MEGFHFGGDSYGDKPELDPDDAQVICRIFTRGSFPPHPLLVGVTLTVAE